MWCGAPQSRPPAGNDDVETLPKTYRTITTSDRPVFDFIPVVAFGRPTTTAMMDPKFCQQNHCDTKIAEHTKVARWRADVKISNKKWQIDDGASPPQQQRST